MSRRHRKNKTPVWKVILCIIFFPFVIYYFIFRGIIMLLRSLRKSPPGHTISYNGLLGVREITNGDNMKRVLTWILILGLAWFILGIFLMVFGLEDAGASIMAGGIFIIPAAAVLVVLISNEYNKYKTTANKNVNVEIKPTVEHTEKPESSNLTQVPVYEAYLKPKEPTPEEIMEAVDNMEGHVFEHFVADILKGVGYYNVQVTPGSGDYGVDILAEMNGVRYAFQCKCYSSPLGLKPIQEVNAGKYHYKAHVGVVVTNSTFTPAAVEIAEDTGVLLWDRNKLIHEIALMSRMKSL